MEITDESLLIFDLDGTLIDSLPDITDATNHMLVRLGRQKVSKAEVQKMVGGGVRQLLRIATGSENDTELDEAGKHFSDYYGCNYCNKTKPFSSIPKLLATLHQHSVNLAVYSNKLHAYTTDILHHLDLSPYFSWIQGADPSLFNPKPSPDGIHYIINQVKADPCKAVMIGDSTHDVEAAKAAKIVSCAITTGYRTREELQSVRPDYILDDITQIVHWVSSK